MGERFEPCPACGKHTLQEREDGGPWICKACKKVVQGAALAPISPESAPEQPERPEKGPRARRRNKTMPKGIPGSGKAALKAKAAAGGSVDAAIRAMIQAELPGAIQAFFAKAAGTGDQQ